MRLIEHPRARSAYLVLVLFTLLAGDFWRYTVGWAGFGVLAAIVAAASILLLVSQRARWRVGGLPYPLLAFLLVATLSLVWSFYPAATALGLAATYLTSLVALTVAVTFTWRDILRGLGLALRWVLGLSLLFEFVVAAIIRNPVLPPVAQPGIDYSTLDDVPRMLYWSREELFEIFDSGRIQGIVGNSALLGFVALLGVIVFGLQWASASVRRRTAVLWLAASAFALLATRSATITIALVAVVVVALAVMLLRRARSARATAAIYGGIAVVGLGTVLSALLLQGPILAALGKSPDLTGRIGIWNAVIDYASTRPVVGWGWVSYWLPWIEPFSDEAFLRNGVQQTHAHNAWLDIWLQLGAIGLVVVGALVLSTLVRSWSFAIDRPQTLPGRPGNHTAVSLLPLLLLIALLVQSLAESRLLVEFGWMMLVLLAIKTKFSPDIEPAVSTPSRAGVR